ncbi:MAG: hypothetical protein EON90_10795 [Brevundimonas sp.]|nr:MAG: hypothetical protein EON90_10795 [Brevundimonas sp.]
MAWYLQTPVRTGPKLVQAIGKCSEGATEVAGAFAYATATGVRLMFSEPAICKVAELGKVALIVGTDAITDTGAINALTELEGKYPGLSVLAFLNPGGGNFHPKTMFFEQAEAGFSVTGSGNLTVGGLRSNWEAYEVRELDKVELGIRKAAWGAWLDDHADHLKKLDDPAVIAKAAENRANANRIKKVIAAKPEEAEALVEIVLENEQAEIVAPAASILIAEVPKNGARLSQVGFDVKTFQEYFGVSLGLKKPITLYRTDLAGVLSEAEPSESVEVASDNYRFEVKGLTGVAYPEEGHPILIFDRLADDVYRYLLLLPGEAQHTTVQDYLNATGLRKGLTKLRVTMSRDILNQFWPESPLT